MVRARRSARPGAVALGLTGILLLLVGCSTPGASSDMDRAGAVRTARPSGGGAAAVASVPAGNARRPAVQLPELSPPGNAPGAARPLRSRLARLPAGSPATGARLRVHDDDEGTHGLAWQLASDHPAGDGLTLETVFLDHDLPPPAPGLSPGGHSLWGATLAADAWDGRLSLQAEYAFSHRRAAAGRWQQPAANADALQFRVGWTDRLPGPADSAPEWTLALERGRAEPGFRGSGGAAAAAGERVERVVTRLDWGRLEAHLGRDLARSGLDGTPRQRRRLDAELRYQGRAPARLPLAAGLIGTPQYRLALDRKVPAGGGAEDAAALGAVFDRGRWTWGVRHRRVRTEAPSAAGAVARRAQTRLHLELPMGARLTLRPSLEWVTRQPAAGALPLRYWSAHLAAAAAVRPERVKARLDLRARGGRDGRDRGGFSVRSGLEWIFPALPGRRPRFNLSLDGRLEYVDPVVGPIALHRYQARAALEVSWAP